MVSDFAFVQPTFDDIDTRRGTFGVNDFVESLLDGKREVLRDWPVCSYSHLICLIM